jgi:hypothetical protein
MRLGLGEERWGNGVDCFAGERGRGGWAAGCAVVRGAEAIEGLFGVEAGLREVVEVTEDELGVAARGVG